MVGRLDKGGETAQRYVTAGERSEPAVIQTLKRGLRRSPIALPKHHSTSPKPISKAHFYPQVRFAHPRLRIVEPLQGSMTRFTPAKPSEEANRTRFTSAKPSEVANRTRFMSAKPSEVANRTRFMSGKPSEVANRTRFMSGKPSEEANRTRFTSGKPFFGRNKGCGKSIKP